VVDETGAATAGDGAGVTTAASATVAHVSTHVLTLATLVTKTPAAVLSPNHAVIHVERNEITKAVIETETNTLHSRYEHYPIKSILVFHHRDKPCPSKVFSREAGLFAVCRSYS
jgi:hypothetical protein